MSRSFFILPFMNNLLLYLLEIGMKVAVNPGQADFIPRKCTCFFPKGQLPFLYILPAYSLEGSSCFPIGRILVTM